MLLRRYNKDAFVKLLQLALGLHALLMVQDLLADAQVLRGDLQQLVLCQELQAALQAQLAKGEDTFCFSFCPFSTRNATNCS